MAMNACFMKVNARFSIYMALYVFNLMPIYINTMQILLFYVRVYYFIFLQQIYLLKDYQNVLSSKNSFVIDGSNFFATAKLLDLDIDYAKMLSVFADKGDLYALIITQLCLSYLNQHLLKSDFYLDYNGFQVVSKQTREFIDPASGKKRIKGNMDMELALDMLKLAPHIDHAYLFSGDGDFCRLLKRSKI